MKKIYALVAAAAFAVSSFAANPDKMYLIGEPAGEWSPMVGLEMTKTADGVFEISVTFPGKQYFSFANQLMTSADWDTFNSQYRYVPANNTQEAVEGAQPLKLGAGSPDSWYLPEGAYTLEVNTNTMILNVKGNIVKKPLGDLYLRGGMNDWNAVDAYKFTTTDNNVYVLDGVKLEAGVEWKIADDDYTYQYVAWPNDEPDSQLYLQLNTTYYYNASPGMANNAMENDVESAKITLNIAEETIVVTESTGISAIEAATDAPAVYYNLQGVRVANPENGLFIRVQNGKAAKVVL